MNNFICPVCSFRWLPRHADDITGGDCQQCAVRRLTKELAEAREGLLIARGDISPEQLRDRAERQEKKQYE